jgi:hypothetical protein
MRIVAPLFMMAIILAVGTSLNEASAQSNDLYDRSVVIENRSSYGLIEFRASNRNDNSWGPDLLGNMILRSGYRIKLDVDDGSGYCMYDFMATFSNGAKIRKYNIDVCTIVEYAYYD